MVTVEHIYLTTERIFALSAIGVAAIIFVVAWGIYEHYLKRKEQVINDSWEWAVCEEVDEDEKDILLYCYNCYRLIKPLGVHFHILKDSQTYEVWCDSCYRVKNELPNLIAKVIKE